MAKLPDDLSKLSHEALTALSHCGDSEIEQQAKDALQGRYSSRMPIKDGEFVVSIEAEITARIKCAGKDEASTIALQEITSKNNNCGLIPLQQCDPRVLVLGINVACGKISVREDIT